MNLYYTRYNEYILHIVNPIGLILAHVFNRSNTVLQLVAICGITIFS